MKETRATPYHRFAFQCLDNVNYKLYTYAKCDQTIPCGSRIMSIFTKTTTGWTDASWNHWMTAQGSTVVSDNIFYTKTILKTFCTWLGSGTWWRRMITIMIQQFERITWLRGAFGKQALSMSHVPIMRKSDRSVCDMHATYSHWLPRYNETKFLSVTLHFYASSESKT